MARSPRRKSERLGEKLVEIRRALGLSQSEMLRLLSYEEAIYYKRISDYELNKRIPPLPLVLEYARAAGVHMEDIVDDELDLPKRLPGKVRHEGVRHSSPSRKRRA
jgi:transcriptional regulator with XRE-family HTH domain